MNQQPNITQQQDEINLKTQIGNSKRLCNLSPRLRRWTFKQKKKYFIEAKRQLNQRAHMEGVDQN